MTSSAKDYLGRVQALRFFAAFGVLVAHVQHEVASRLMPGHPFPQFTLIDGGMGVDVFFLISGFIMYHISAADFGRPGASRTFLTRRFLRVAPLYYLATAMMLAVIAVLGDHVDSGRVSVAQAAASFLFFPYANAMGQAVPILKLGWTLNYEIYFYVAFGLALLFSRRIGLALMVGGLAAMVVVAALIPGRAVPLDFWGNSIVFEFLGGMGIAMLYARGVRLSRGAAWGAIAAGLVLVMSLRGFGLNPYMPRCLFHGVPAALIVGGVVFGALGQTRNRAMRLLELGGDASFALYLFHPFAIRAATIGWALVGGPATPWLLIAVIVVVAVAASIAINLLIEKPFDRWLRTKVSRRAAPLGATT